MEFRQDIQALRGVAVIYVIFFHLEIPGFSSGFLGVDVFFVISGFLMQKLYAQSGGVFDFYGRRARRLLPAYFLTVLGVMISSFVLTLPSEYNQVSQQSIWASILSSNIGFWTQASYFEKDYFNPLLHLWSLGVEFQFYLIFPFIFYITTKRNWLLSSAVLASAIGCLVVTEISPKTSFFMVPFRFWEFGIGMLAARMPDRVEPKLCVVGPIGLICLLVVPIDGQIPNAVIGHPGLAAVLASCFAACTLVWRVPPAALERASFKGLSGLGGVSYSLYLVHFPIIVLVNYKPFGGTNLGGTTNSLPVMLTLMAIATVISFYCFEKPARIVYSHFRALFAAAFTCLAAMVTPSWQMRSFDDSERKIFAALHDKGEYRCGKIFRVLNPRSQSCRIAGHSTPTILLVGDSHADALKPALAASVSRYGGQLFLTVANDPLVNPSLGPDWVTGEAKRLGASTVVLHFSVENLRLQQIVSTHQKLKSIGIESVLVAPIPVYSVGVPEGLYREYNGLGAVDRQNFVDHEGAIYGTTKFAKDHGLPILDLTSKLCSPQCRLADVSGKPLYTDASHLSVTGAHMVESAFDDLLQRAKREKSSMLGR